MPDRLAGAEWMGAPVQHFFLYVLALGAGFGVTTQQVLNGSLRTALGSQPGRDWSAMPAASSAWSSW